MGRRSRRRLGAWLAAVLSLVATLALTGPAPARADVINPRQQWLRDSQAGLFLHWGMRTSPGYTDCSAWEKAVTDGGWKADYWVAEAKQLHASYLVLASFHSRLGYARAWPSAVPGSCSTKRDFLGELIDAANAQGLKVMLYMTDDPQWHAEGGHEWLDSAAYSAYKGHDVDLTTRDGFGEYSYDNFVEVMRKYPKLSGFWIDNDNDYWIDHGLYEKIRADRPGWLLSNNNEDTPIMDTVSNEQKTGMTPAYDYPQAIWTPQPRLTEACFKLPSSGAWWYSGTDSAVDHGLTLGRLISNSGSSVKSLMAETAQVNGRFPSKQEAFNDYAKSYLDKIWGSLGGTEGGGYSYGGLRPGAWNDGAHGVTTVSKTDPDRHFVHVLTRPSGSTLTVRDNGYKATAVTDFRTGKKLNFRQSDGRITISGITGWDPYDTVLAVRTDGRQGVVPASSITASASVSASGHPASAVLDGDPETYWDNSTTLPASVTFDLRSAKSLRYLAVNQREWSVSYARSDTEQSARIRDYQVQVSSDGRDWGSPVASGTLPSARGVAFIDLPATTKRYVRLTVNSTWAAATDTKHYRKLLLDEVRIGTAYPSSGS
ncbi:discoidin domain-containing protein [Streptomyces violaceusniger]|uniref:alpha-L-fucosidase n=1 Tax=Streptomyces violaceusniger (strain Tu 4113) TaxID=653045 RepID=G2NZD7_STRV4|nr:discoidin domain-containing protein [Streptomyces violaceusniger]AEM83406.1 coagulation factor 5/8 type domain protein [Streptomyces violaceusniger Tu 4113]